MKVVASGGGQIVTSGLDEHSGVLAALAGTWVVAGTRSASRPAAHLPTVLGALIACEEREPRRIR